MIKFINENYQGFVEISPDITRIDRQITCDEMVKYLNRLTRIVLDMSRFKFTNKGGNRLSSFIQSILGYQGSEIYVIFDSQKLRYWSEVRHDAVHGPGYENSYVNLLINNPAAVVFEIVNDEWIPRVIIDPQSRFEYLTKYDPDQSIAIINEITRIKNEKRYFDSKDIGTVTEVQSINNCMKKYQWSLDDVKSAFSFIL